MRKTERFITMLLMTAIMLAGCGSKESTPTQSESVVTETESESQTDEDEKEIENLYETEELVTKTIGDIEYQIPKEWEGDCEETESGICYHYEGGYIWVWSTTDFIYGKKYSDIPDEKKKIELQQCTSDAVSDLMMFKLGETSFNKNKILLENFFDVGNQDAYQAICSISRDDGKFMSKSISIVSNNTIYVFAMLKNADLEDKIDFHYEQLIDSIRGNNRLEDDGKIKSEEEYLEKFSEISTRLKEIYKKYALDLIPYSEEESKDYFEIVITSSKELARRGSELESEEEIVDDDLYGPFCLSAGYLCNNYDEDTEYGKVGNRAFDLALYIAIGDNKNRDKVLEEFDIIAKNHGMEMMTIDDFKSREKGVEEDGVDIKESIALSTGKYIVGEDIPSGKYDIIGVSEGYVSVCSQGKTYGDVLHELITPGEVVYANVRLEDGYEVEIVVGGKVQLQPK